MKSFFLGSFLCLASAMSWGLEIPVRRGGPSGSSVGYVDMELVFREYPEARKAREDYRTEVLRHKGELAERERALDDLKREIESLKGTTASIPAVERSSAPVDLGTPPVSRSSSTSESVVPGSNFSPLSVPKPSTGEVPYSSVGLSPSEDPVPLLTSTPSVQSTPGAGLSPVVASPSPVPFPPAVSSTATATISPPAVSTATAASVAEGLARREEQLLKRQKELEEARASSAQALKAFEASRAKTILGRLYKALVELANERGISIVVDKSAILYGQNTIDLTEALNRRVRGLPEEEK